MGDVMDFPEKWETFLHDYEFEDARRIYTNGSRLIPSFRVKQMMEHYLDDAIASEKAKVDICAEVIKRQETEIERLKRRNNFIEIEWRNISNLWSARVNSAKAEAIKEFAERLCTDRVADDPVVIAAKRILQEMTEEHNG